VIITATGFARWEQKDIALSQGDARTLPNIALKIGSVIDKIEVVSSSEAVAPQTPVKSARSSTRKWFTSSH